MHKFFDTALGKSIRTFLWVIAAYGVMLVSVLTSSVHWSGALVAAGVPGLINWVLYTVFVLANKNIPNLPSSPSIPEWPPAILGQGTTTPTNNGAK